jgi:hypothetical protein
MTEVAVLITKKKKKKSLHIDKEFMGRVLKRLSNLNGKWRAKPE